MRAHAVVVAGPGARPGSVCYRTLRSDPPLLLRPTPIGLHLMGGAAGPLGGDELDLEVHVEAGATLVVRSVAASLILPGDARSDLRIRATVGPGARLDWAPEPTVSVAGSRHGQRVDVDMAEDAELRWAETLVVGRTGEAGGAMDAGLRIEVGAVPVVHQQLACGPGAPGWEGAATLGPHRVVTTEVDVGGVVPSGVHHCPTSGARAMTVAVADGVTLTQAVAPDVPAATAVREALANRPGPG